MDEQSLKEKLKDEGYIDLDVSKNEANKDFGMHTHDKNTVQMILNGELIVEDNGNRKTYKSGDRVEFAKGTSHKTMTGPDGCDFIFGFKD